MRILLLAVLVTTARAHLGGSHGSPDEERHSQFQDSSPGFAGVPPPPEPATASVSLRTSSSPAGGQAPASPCPQICPFDYRPICGSDGVTYTNDCTFSKAVCKNRALQQSYVGPCLPQLDPSTTDVGNAGSSVDPGVAPTSLCSERCQRIFLPVCGSDGLTYNNPCILQFADCTSREAGGRGISVAREGSCEDGGLATQDQTVPIPDPTSGPVEVFPPAPQASTCSEKCNRIFVPVCGSDGISYNNLCLLQIADCKNRETGGSGVDVAHEGSCSVSQDAQRPGGTGPSDVASVGDATAATASPCKQECPRIFLPVCGSDGNSYNNKCLLDLASCEGVQAGGSEIIAVSEGLCAAQDTHHPEGTGSADAMDVGGGGTTQAPISACLTACNKNYLPVCGSDGNSYNNRCELDVASCESVQAGGGEISFVADGLCGVPQDTKGQDAVDVGATTPAPTTRCRPECPKIYLPVCGSDGNSYNNKCLLDLASCERVQARGSEITAVSEGLCGTQEPGATVGPDVMGAGGATPTPASTCQTACTRDFVPVCGSDGKRYDNECLLNIASCESFRAGGGQITVVSEGFCAPAVTSAPDAGAVTGEEGAKGTSPCRQECTKTFLPVCASDGNTYDNECILTLASCRRRKEGGRGLYVVTTGSCGSRGGKDDGQYKSCRECNDAYEPVCGNDGHTYDNECILDNNNCKSWQVGKPGIYIVKHGICGDFRQTAPPHLLAEASDTSPILSSLGVSTRTSSCPDLCTQDYSPVCGTDNLTYDNKCVLLRASCRLRSSGEAGIAIAFDGPCVAALPRGPVCDTGCDKSMSPVCGSDGLTYGNPCLLSVADCLNPFISITRVSDGPCDSSEEEEEDTKDVELGHGVHGGYLPPV